MQGPVSSLFGHKCKNGILHYRCKGVNLKKLWHPSWILYGQTGSCLNASESVVENLHLVWPQQHLKLGKWCILAFFKVHVTFWPIFT